MSHQHASGLEVVRHQEKEWVQPTIDPSWKYTPDLNSHGTSRHRQMPHDTVCGVSRKVFFITTVIATAIIIAAALAGGLAGALSHRNHTAPEYMTAASTASVTSSSIPSASSAPATASASTSTSSASAASTSTSTATASAASSSATYNSDCPTSNNQIYVSNKFAGGANGSPPSGSINGFRFQKKCSFTYLTYQNLAQTYVASFNACIDLCASYNFWNNVTTCIAVSYIQSGDCWIKSSTAQGAARSGVDSAVLLAP